MAVQIGSECASSGRMFKAVRICFLNFRDSPFGRQAYMQSNTLAVWEVMFLLRSRKGNVAAGDKHLR